MRRMRRAGPVPLRFVLQKPSVRTDGWVGQYSKQKTSATREGRDGINLEMTVKETVG